MPLINRGEGRDRFNKSRQYRNRISHRADFVNPFPWMSAPEAMIQLLLMENSIPFSWRYFNDVSPTLALLLPDYHPEFTLRDYRIVIQIFGTYYGSLPGQLDRDALGAVALQEDGWRIVQLWEGDIYADLQGALYRQAPELRVPTIRGTPYPSPFERPNYIETRRKWLTGWNIRRKKFIRHEPGAKERDGNPRRPSRRRDRRTRSVTG